MQDRWPPHHHTAEVLTLTLRTDEDKVAGETPPKPGRAPGSASQPLKCVSSCSGDRRPRKVEPLAQSPPPATSAEGMKMPQMELLPGGGWFSMGKGRVELGQGGPSGQCLRLPMWVSTARAQHRGPHSPHVASSGACCAQWKTLAGNHRPPNGADHPRAAPGDPSHQYASHVTWHVQL